MSRRLRSAALAAAALLMLAASAARAQEMPESSEISTLIADRVEINAEGQLVASGNVEAMQGDARLKAERITYDPETEQLVVEGPVILQQGENSVLFADSAELSRDLQDGLIRSARVVLDQQLQIGAVEIDRVGGRYTQLYNTVASACEVCAARPVPLWQIRAERVVHDSVEKQLYFDNAIFEVMGVPVMYLPQLRLPDPTVERATGFLAPVVRTTDDLGPGLKIPYFIALNDHRDLLLTPYVSTGWTRTLEFRYREAFRKGRIEANGAVSIDNILPNELRGYFFGLGYFQLPKGFNLAFDIETVSDDTYFQDYDYSDKDRLDSAMTIWRVRNNRLFEAQVIGYKSLRSDESNQTQPYRVSDLTWYERTQPPLLGGWLTYAFQAHGHQRRSTDDVIGRDVARLSGHVDWQRSWVGPQGLVFNAGALGYLDHTAVSHDSNYPDAVTEFVPFGVAEVRWPWVRNGARAGQVIEPVVQLVWSPGSDTETPNDESTQIEFDEGNLFSISRFSSGDERERGLRANVGLTYSRYDPSGWAMNLTFGRIFRFDEADQFTGYASLDGTESDWLTAVQLTLPYNLSITNRTLFNNAFDVSKTELEFDWRSARFDLGTSYIWLEPSEVEGRYDYTNEWTLDADWQMTERWSSVLDWRYDFVLDRSASAELGIEFQTECATFDLAVERSFSTTDQIDPSTSYTFEVRLAGFGTPGGGRSRPSRIGCRG